jgi:hypothetical protein
MKYEMVWEKSAMGNLSTKVVGSTLLCKNCNQATSEIQREAMNTLLDW